MVVIAYSAISEYIEINNKEGVVVDALNNWFRVVNAADWANLNELKQIFNTVDYVGNDRYVFNVMGNHYRIIAMIHFKVRTVYILFIGTHKEYDKVDPLTVKYKKKKS